MPPQFQSQFDPANKIPNPVDNPVPQKSHKKIIWLVLLVVIIVAIIGGLFLWRNHNRNNLIEVTIPLDQIDPTANWKTYTNTENGFEFKYPPDWSSVSSDSSTGPWMLQSSSTAEIVHGIGLPSEGAWINIAKGVCNNPTDDFVAESKPDILEKTVCQDGFQITLGLWQNDKNLIKDKYSFDEILSTFQLTATSTSTVDMSNWKTYKTGGFEFRYPNNYQITNGKNYIDIFDPIKGLKNNLILQNRLRRDRYPRQPAYGYPTNTKRRA